MQDILVVIDMQNDFVSGVLGTPEAREIIQKVRDRILSFDGRVYYTRDTHGENYMSTREGKYLPVPHCIRGSYGWEIIPELCDLRSDGVFDKPTFGSCGLIDALVREHLDRPIRSITLIGVCTDICVISNAMLLKAALPEVDLIVDSSCCAGVTPESHTNALSAMRACQIDIL